MTEILQKIPPHLKRYVVGQDYSKYTPIDQAVWRFIMRQLNFFLKENAHPIYSDGLRKTGIQIDSIPKIEEMNLKLKNFGWQAVAVSGFIPPAAFMELQSLSILPIATDMRSLEHLGYTPAPDIVHEAAGHAPILADPDFASYLKKYASVARKAILSKEDLDVYEAIRSLSDLKESPEATAEDIQKAMIRLENAKNSVQDLSEAALLARMNWWTAEYGLIGSLDQPKIFGAGLLSSVAESRSCLESSTTKLPFSLECLNFNYDITEPQPQVFVTGSFQELSLAIEQLSQTMAYRVGGRRSLERIIWAKTVNTVQLDSGLQISGLLNRYQPSYVPTASGLAYLMFIGPCQLALDDEQLQGHGRQRHPSGFGCPIGYWKGFQKRPWLLTDKDLNKQGIEIGKLCTIETEAGVSISGIPKTFFRDHERLLIMTFQNCTVRFGVEIFFQPEWGEYDLVLGCEIPSVFGGAADRVAFGDTGDFANARVPEKKWDLNDKKRMARYTSVRILRDDLKNTDHCTTLENSLSDYFSQPEIDQQRDWLFAMECLEIIRASDIQQYPHLKKLKSKWESQLEQHLNNVANENRRLQSSILDGLAIAHRQEF